jgi:hypothetical protein
VKEEFVEADASPKFHPELLTTEGEEEEIARLMLNESNMARMTRRLICLWSEWNSLPNDERNTSRRSQIHEVVDASMSSEWKEVLLRHKKGDRGEIENW